MDTQLNKYGVVKLNNNELTKVNGGCRLCRAWKYAKRGWNWITNLDAVSQIVDGYQQCNDV